MKERYYGEAKKMKSHAKRKRTPTLRVAMHESEERLAGLIDNLVDIYWEQDEGYRFTLIKGRQLEKSGIDPEQYLGKTRWDQGEVPEADGGSWDAHKAVLEARQPFFETVFTRVGQQGEKRYIRASGYPFFDRAGEFKGYRGTARDITASRRGEQLVALEHAVNRSLAEADSVSNALQAAMRAVCECEGWECGRYLRVDERAGVLHCGEAWGVASPEIDGFLAGSRTVTYMPGQGLAGRVWQSGQPIWVADINTDPRTMQKLVTREIGLHGAMFFPVISEGAAIGVLAFNSREFREPDERLLRAVSVIGSQIGQYVQRKSAEEEQRRFRAAMDASADLMLLIDPAAMRYVDANDAACRALGYSRGELLALGPQDLLFESREELADTYRRLITGDLSEATVEGWCRRKDGSRLAIEMTRRVLRSAQGEVIVAIAREIGERRRAEQLLRLEHTVNRALADAESLGAGLKAALRAICETEAWDCGRYLRVDEAAGVLRHGEDWGIQNEGIERFLAASRKVTYAPGNGLAGRAWQARQPLWVAEVNKDGRAKQGDLLIELGMNGAIFFPVFSEGKVMGMLTFHSREVREPSERLLQAVTAIGSQIGQFVRRKQAEDVLRDSEERFRSLTQLSSDIYWEQDEEFRFTSIAGKGSNRIKVAADRLLGRRRWEHDYVNMSADDWAAHKAVLEAHQAFRDFELCRLDESGEKVWISVSGEPVFDSAGVFKGYRGVGKDITERKRGEERIHYLASHDPLTGLPNRTMFGEVLNFALQSAQRYEGHFAVLFLDLDRFKVINDTLGHEAGDKLLREIARRLTDTVRKSDVVARLGGDEFVILVQQVSEAKQVEAVARKILSAVMKPMLLEGQECRVTASIGVCMYPADAVDEQALMKNADIAMYRAKEQGKNTFIFYSEETNTHSFERLALEASLRRGLERNEFFLYYQAKIDLGSKEITGVEALVRWKHPDMGIVPPAQFIPVAEETGLIIPIGRWVLNAACRQNVEWQRQGLPPLRISVNLSSRQFTEDSLLQDIVDALEDSGMKPELLELELTESTVMQNYERAGKVLEAIKKMGVRLAIDDFGVGYSSLTHLKYFPIDTLKVDRSFIRDLPQDAEDKAITEAIIAMGKSLNLTVVAEGVETLEQQSFLHENDCDEAQGFLFSKPVSNEQFAELLKQRIESRLT